MRPILDVVSQGSPGSVKKRRMMVFSSCLPGQLMCFGYSVVLNLFIYLFFGAGAQTPGLVLTRQAP